MGNFKASCLQISIVHLLKILVINMCSWQIGDWTEIKERFMVIIRVAQVYIRSLLICIIPQIYRKKNSRAFSLKTLLSLKFIFSIQCASSESRELKCGSPRETLGESKHKLDESKHKPVYLWQIVPKHNMTNHILIVDRSTPNLT